MTHPTTKTGSDAALDLDQMRAEFETWAISEGFDIAKWGDGEYCSDLHRYWLGWQAAMIAQARAAAPAPNGWKGSLAQVVMDVPLPERNDKYQAGFVDAKATILQALRDAGFDRAASQPAPVLPQPFTPTEQQYAEWCERHDLPKHLSRDAFDDAVSLYLVSVSQQPAQACKHEFYYFGDQAIVRRCVHCNKLEGE